MIVPQSNWLSLRTDRLRRSLQNFHDPQTGESTRDRTLTITQTVHEVLHLRLQSLFSRDMRRPHISGSIANSELMRLLRRAVHGDTLVVNLDLLGRFDVII